jgi:hypothetical protein
MEMTPWQSHLLNVSRCTSRVVRHWQVATHVGDGDTKSWQRRFIDYVILRLGTDLSSSQFLDHPMTVAQTMRVHNDVFKLGDSR